VGGLLRVIELFCLSNKIGFVIGYRMVLDRSYRKGFPLLLSVLHLLVTLPAAAPGPAMIRDRSTAADTQATSEGINACL
jgi:hypothetical protein